MTASNGENRPQVRVTSQDVTTIIRHAADIHIHELTRPELRELSEAGLSIGLPIGLAAASLGVCATLVVSIYAVPPAEDRTLAVFVGAAIATGVIGAFFGVTGFRGWRKLRSLLKTRLETERTSGSGSVDLPEPLRRQLDRYRANVAAERARRLRDG